MPPVPADLERSGTESWSYLWRLHWLVDERHWHTVYRYCQLQDLLAAAFTQIRADGLMIDGSTKQKRVHPAVTEIRQLATEARRTEIELGLTPAAESKAGVSKGGPPITVADTMREASDEAAGINEAAGSPMRAVLGLIEGGASRSPR